MQRQSCQILCWFRPAQRTARTYARKQFQTSVDSTVRPSPGQQAGTYLPCHFQVICKEKTGTRSFPNMLLFLVLTQLCVRIGRFVADSEANKTGVSTFLNIFHSSKRQQVQECRLLLMTGGLCRGQARPFSTLKTWQPRRQLISRKHALRCLQKVYTPHTLFQALLTLLSSLDLPVVTQFFHGSSPALPCFQKSRRFAF